MNKGKSKKNVEPVKVTHGYSVKRKNKKGQVTEYVVNISNRGGD